MGGLPSPTRRTLVVGGGTAVATALAGCGSPGGEGEEQDETVEQPGPEEDAEEGHAEESTPVKEEPTPDEPEDEDADDESS